MSLAPRTEPIIQLTVAAPGEPRQRLDLSARVLSFAFEDNAGKADKLTLAIDNWDLANFDNPTFRKGNELEVSWGYVGNMAPTRTVVIQKVTGAQRLNVEGQALSVLMNKVARCRTFEHVKRSDVVRQIARENGYGPERQDIEDTAHTLACITQARWTDAQLLRRLAQQEGFEMYVDFDGLHFHRRRVGQRPSRILWWYTPPTIGEVLSFNIENDITGKPGAVETRGRDPLRKTDVVARGSNNDTPRDGLAPVLEIVDPETGATRLERRNSSAEVRPTAEPTVATAKREADKHYLGAQHTTVELAASIVGDPSLLAKTVVSFQGLGQRLSGTYYVTVAKHRIEGDGYVTELKCLRDGHSEVGGAPSKSHTTPTPASQDARGAPTADTEALQPIERVDAETGRTRIDYVDSRGRAGKGAR